MCPRLITAGFTAPRLHRVRSFNVPPARRTEGRTKRHTATTASRCILFPRELHSLPATCIFGHILWLNFTWPHHVWNKGMKWDRLLWHKSCSLSLTNQKILRSYILNFDIFKSPRGLRETLHTQTELLQSSWRSFFWASFLDQLQCSVQKWLCGIARAPLLREQLVCRKVRGRSLCTWGKWRWVMRGEAQSGDSFPCYEWVVENRQSFGAFLPRFCSSLSAERKGDLSPAAISSSSPSPRPPKMGLLCFLRGNSSSSLVQSRAWAEKPALPPTAPPVKVGLSPLFMGCSRRGLGWFCDLT